MSYFLNSTLPAGRQAYFSDYILSHILGNSHQFFIVNAYLAYSITRLSLITFTFISPGTLNPFLSYRLYP